LFLQIYESRNHGVAKLTPKTLNLSDDERTQLQQLINRHNTPQQIARRARIIEEAEVKPHQSRYWLTPPEDAEFDAKVADITGLYMSAIERHLQHSSWLNQIEIW
jgi:hypothetical protein